MENVVTGTCDGIIMLLKLPDKDFKPTIIEMIEQAIENTLTTNIRLIVSAKNKRQWGKKENLQLKNIINIVKLTIWTH